jgi:glycosyltransferase involved in cell wall biosynthesis
MYNKPVILSFVGNYLPGYKAGGILRITINTVDHLCDVFDFKIVTRDRDLGDDVPYPDIQTNEWQQVGNAMVFYLPPQSNTIKNIVNLIASTPHDVLYLNSFFDPLTIKVLWNRMFHPSNYKPVIVAPWGEFGWASLKQKYIKKILFIQLSKLLGLYKNITWRASSDFEAKEISKVMKIKSDSIQIIGDLPIKNIPEIFSNTTIKPSIGSEDLRIVFLSRISREKNLDYAIQVISRVKASVIFDIYGPAENVAYWKECQKLIEQLPANVKVNYRGNANQNQVLQLFSQYDLFLFPTGGEAYGHVIAESLIAGTPVLISDKTPWRNLQSDGLGWDLSLEELDKFVEVIENYSSINQEQRAEKRNLIKLKIIERLLDPRVFDSNIQLFKRLIK